MEHSDIWCHIEQRGKLHYLRNLELIESQIVMGCHKIVQFIKIEKEEWNGHKFD